MADNKDKSVVCLSSDSVSDNSDCKCPTKEDSKLGDGKIVILFVTHSGGYVFILVFISSINTYSDTEVRNAHFLFTNPSLSV